MAGCDSAHFRIQHHFVSDGGGWFGNTEGLGWLKSISNSLHPGQPVYVLLYAAAIVFFCYFYTALVFNPEGNRRQPKRAALSSRAFVR